jgi:hypothetical protein
VQFLQKFLSLDFDLASTVLDELVSDWESLLGQLAGLTTVAYVV